MLLMRFLLGFLCSVFFFFVRVRYIDIIWGEQLVSLNLCEHGTGGKWNSNKS